MKLQPLIAILTSLLQKERISATWFSEKFGVSVRTIYRDISALEDAGIPIVTHPGLNGGFSIIEEYKIDKKLFTHQDISTLLTGLYSVSGSLSDVKINQTLEKIKGLIPKEYGKSIELASRQLFIDLKPWSDNPRVGTGLQTIQKALESGRLICFDYDGRHSSSTKRIVEPYQLVLKENNWYLYAYCRNRSDFRTFKLSRIADIEILSEHFVPREFKSGMADFKDWQNETAITVELVIDESIRERALDYCREEYMRDLGNGKVAVSLPFVESDMGYGVLLGMGHHCRVVSPAHVQSELRRRISLISDLYGPERINDGNDADDYSAC